MPSVLGAGIAVVADNKLLSNTHIHILIRELKSEHLLGDIKHNWVGLSKNEEVEWPIVDVVGDWGTESGGGLAAEDDIEACFLARWDNL